MSENDLSGLNRLERKKEETRKKIIAVAIDLFKNQGFNLTTMEQIAEEADIAKRTLYNHFPVKEAIVDEYVKEISKGLARETFGILPDLPDTRSRLLAALDKSHEWVESNPEFVGIVLGYRFKNMFQSSEGNVDKTGTQSILTEIIEKGQSVGEIRRDVSVKLLVGQIDILRTAIVLNWLKEPSGFELRTEIAKIVDLFMYGAVDRRGQGVAQ